MDNSNCPENSRVSGSTQDSSGEQNAVIYVRQSRTRGTEMSSCDAQLDMCREVAAQRSLVVSKIFSDEGESSETLDRPALQRLITAIETNQVAFASLHFIGRPG